MSTGNHITNSTDSTFEQDVIKSSAPVLVDFWAEWCGPCQGLAPVFSELASEYAEKVKFVKVNIDQSPDTPSQFGVRSIPTLLLFKEGQVIATKVGGASKSDLRDFVDSHI